MPRRPTGPSARARARAVGPLLAVVLAAGCAAGPADDAARADLPGATPAPAAPSAAPTAGAPPATPADRFDDTALTGTGPGLRELQVLVGVDVLPGTYRTVEPQVDDGVDGGILTDRSCRFGQYAGGEQRLADLLAGGTADGGHLTVTLSEGQLFRTQRCGEWRLVPEGELFDSPATAPTSVGDGMWLVGEDLRPGTYRTQASFDPEADVDAWCLWEVDSSWTDWDAEVVEVAIAGPGPGEVTVATGQQLVSTGCGTWELVAP